MTPEQTKTFLEQRFTLDGRIFHANILTAKAKKGKSRQTFDLMVAWNRQSNAQEFAKIAQFIAQASQMVHPGANIASPMFMNPLKWFGPGPLQIHGITLNEYFRQNGSPNADYLRDHVWVNASTGFAPVVCKPMGPQFPGQFVNLGPQDEAEVYGGRNAVVQISFYAQIPKPGDENQRRGFGVNFHAVMLKEGGERVAGGDGASNVDVAQVFGAFAGDMGMGAMGGQQAPQTNFNNSPQQNNGGYQQNGQNYNPGNQNLPPQQNFQGNGQTQHFGGYQQNNGQGQNFNQQSAPSNLPPLNNNAGNQGSPFAQNNGGTPNFAQSGPGPQQNQQQQQQFQNNNYPPVRGY